MSKSSRPFCVWIGCMLLFIGIVGCGGGPANINGKVSYKGVPVTGGAITLTFDDGKQTIGSIDGTGKYTIQSVTTGKAKVTVNTESVKASGLPKMPGMQKDASGAALPVAAGADATSYMKIPSKYADPQKSDLTYDVKSGAHTKDFDLTD